MMFTINNFLSNQLHKIHENHKHPKVYENHNEHKAYKTHNAHKTQITPQIHQSHGSHFMSEGGYKAKNFLTSLIRLFSITSYVFFCSVGLMAKEDLGPILQQLKGEVVGKSLKGPCKVKFEFNNKTFEALVQSGDEKSGIEKVQIRFEDKADDRLQDTATTSAPTTSTASSASAINAAITTKDKNEVSTTPYYSTSNENLIIKDHKNNLITINFNTNNLPTNLKEARSFHRILSVTASGGEGNDSLITCKMASLKSSSPVPRISEEN